MAARVMPPASVLRDTFTYDPETGVLTWRVGWRRGKPAGGIIRMKSGVTYLRVCFGGSVARQDILVHRLIWKLVTGREPRHEIDHRDGDGLNNRWSNLRAATHQQNQMNIKSQSGTLYPRGVWWIGGPENRRKPFAAAISYQGARYNLGTFATTEEASAAYEKASRLLHAGFSFLARPH